MYLKGKSIIVMSSTVYNDPTGGVYNSHILAQEFAKRGNKVLFIESLGLKNFNKLTKGDVRSMILRLFSHIRMSILGPKSPMPNLYVITPIKIPIFKGKLISDINEKLITRTVNIFSKKYLERKPIIWTFLPVYSFLKHSVSNSLFVFHIGDYFTSMPDVNQKLVAREEMKTFRVSNIIFSYSPTKQKAIKEVVDDKPVLYVNNVARFEQFNKALTEIIDTPKDMLNVVLENKPIIGYIGNMVHYKEDLELLYNLACSTPIYNYVIIGAVGIGEIGTNIDKLTSLPNVYFLGRKDYLDLYKYFKSFDLAIIPRRILKDNFGGIPLKYFEFLSAGIPTILTAIGIVSESSKVSKLGGIANTVGDFKKRIEYWISLKKNNPSEYDKYLKIRIRMAKENSWNNRMIEFEKILLPYITM